MTKKDRIAILGYGSQGRAIALNLRDSGYTVTVGLRNRSKSNKITRQDEIKAFPIRDVAGDSDLIIVALPDHIHSKVLTGKFFDSIGKQPPLVFLHGSSIHFGLVKPPDGWSVILLAPHAPGQAVRENYIAKKHFSAFWAVSRGSLKNGRRIVHQLAKGIGIPSTYLVRTTFGDEAVGDLFGEQAVLCGGLARLLKFGYETLVEAGIPPQNAYIEVAYQLDLIVDLIKHNGLTGMFRKISAMARFGSALNGPKVIPQSVKSEMKKIFEQIESGEFIRQVEKASAKTSSKNIQKLINSSFDRQARKFK